MSLTPEWKDALSPEASCSSTEHCSQRKEPVCVTSRYLTLFPHRQKVLCGLHLFSHTEKRLYMPCLFPEKWLCVYMSVSLSCPHLRFHQHLSFCLFIISECVSGHLVTVKISLFEFCCSYSCSSSEMLNCSGLLGNAFELLGNAWELLGNAAWVHLFDHKLHFVLFLHASHASSLQELLLQSTPLSLSPLLLPSLPVAAFPLVVHQRAVA